MRILQTVKVLRKYAHFANCHSVIVVVVMYLLWRFQSNLRRYCVSVHRYCVYVVAFSKQFAFEFTRPEIEKVVLQGVLQCRFFGLFLTFFN